MIQTAEKIKWTKAAHKDDVPANGGACVKIDGEQVAIFYFPKTEKWYATQNMCPHKHQMILARGMVGDKEGEPKVACPYHKKSFSLETGENMNGEDYCVDVYPVKVEGDDVFVGVKQ